MKIKIKPSKLLPGNLEVFFHGTHHTYFAGIVTRKQMSVLKSKNGRNVKLT